MPEESYSPPYTVTKEIVNLISEISEMLGEITAKNENIPSPRLRRDNNIKTIQASLAIENNSLSIDQVTDIINGKRILAAPNEIREVKNAYEAYERLLEFNPYSLEDLLAAHKILMSDLVNESGRFRNSGVGIFAEERLVHMAPPANQVPILMNQLIKWVKKTTEHTLIKSCVFHYEFEFIHPFSDGNGRLGRMWQTLILYKWKPVFAWLPVETLIRDRQDKYYAALGKSDKSSDSTVFIEFLLNAIFDALKEFSTSDQVNDQESDQVKKVLEVIGDEALSAKEIMERVGLKHLPTFRKNYLNPALEKNLIEMTFPDKPKSRNQKYRKK